MMAYVRFPAPDACCVAKVIREVTEVPSLKWPVSGTRDSRSARQDPPARMVHVEVGKRQAFIATRTVPSFDNHCWRRRLRHGSRGRPADVPGPDACRAERDSQLDRTY